MLLVLALPPGSRAQPTAEGTRALAVTARAERSDAAALGIIFDEQHVPESALQVHERAATMPLDARFQFLQRWVLPHTDHSSFRLHLSFTATHPPPLAGTPVPDSGRRVPAGGAIVSPALDLIAAASALKRLDELRQQIVALPPTAEYNNQIARQAMLALIDMARRDRASAATQLEQLFALTSAEASSQESVRDALLLCVHEAARHRTTSRVVVDPAFRILSGYLNVYDRAPWHRQFSAAFAQVRLMATQDPEAPLLETATSTAPWFAASPPLARYRGAGSPAARWKMEPGQVENIASHDDDYLYFPIPLRGNFEVECDVTGFGWRDSHLLVAGQWVAPVYDHKSYDIGSVRGHEARKTFAPPLTKTMNYIHYRTVVREGIATTWFDGRKIHEQHLPPDHEPWLAIRSSARCDGGVRNLRVTGTPHIPDTLRLSESPDLAGWIPYYGESIRGGNASWRQHVEPDGTPEIRGAPRHDLPRGCHFESLLAYHRPLMEDGSIEYQFWYEPNRFTAHPALDRLCFLLEPDGVKVHWLTDGKFERTALAPHNAFDEAENRRGSRPLPLREGAWNNVRLTVTGDHVSLALNDEAIFERKLETTNQRTIGLFYYADASELRVRSLIWKGDWPSALPAVAEQPLAEDDTAFLDERLPELKAKFLHDFAVAGLPLERFAVLHGDIQHHIATARDGLHVHRPAVEGFRSVAIAPLLKVSGDFDIQVQFDQLITDPREPDTSSTLMLMAVCGNSEADEALLLRRQSLARGLDQQLIQCVRVHGAKDQQRRQYFAHFPMAALSGTLRLARRGGEIYYLFAETDSRQFRLIGQKPFPIDDLAAEGLRIAAQIQGRAGSTSVVWKSLSIYAEELSGPAARDPQQALEQLNRERSKLPASLSHDFTRLAPDDILFQRWTDRRPWRKQDQGLLMVAPGTDHWSSAGAGLQKQLAGDFDISVRLDPLVLDTPAPMDGSSVRLQVELADEGNTQYSIMLNRTPEAETEAVAQLRTANADGSYKYQRLQRISIPTVNELRLARRGKRIYFLASVGDGEGASRIVANVEIGAAPVKFGGTQILVHTGGSGRESRVLWKSIRFSADRISDEDAPGKIVPPPPPDAARSILDIFFK